MRGRFDAAIAICPFREEIERAVRLLDALRVVAVGQRRNELGDLSVEVAPGVSQKEAPVARFGKNATDSAGY
jgi:hypothetical protein